MKNRYFLIYLFLFVFLFLQTACSNKETETTTDTNKTENANVPQNNSDSPYQNIEMAGFERNEEGHFIPTDDNSNIDFIYIQTQRCENCKRLKSLNDYKEEVALAPELKKAYTKKVGAKNVYFAGMVIKEEISIDESRSPAIIAEFMGGDNYIVALSIYPNTGEATYTDYEGVAMKFLEKLVKL